MCQSSRVVLNSGARFCVQARGRGAVRRAPKMRSYSSFRRGFTPASIRNFCDMIGVTRSNGTVDVGMLEAAIREDLDANALNRRAFVVFKEGELPE